MRARAPPVNGRKRPLTKHKEKGRMANAPRADARGDSPFPDHPFLFHNRTRFCFGIAFENCILGALITIFLFFWPVYRT